jgi:hypothetical protein
MSNCGHAPIDRVSSAMLTPRTSSLTATTALPLQSPGHSPGGGGLGVGSVSTTSVGVVVAELCVEWSRVMWRWESDCPWVWPWFGELISVGVRVAVRVDGLNETRGWRWFACGWQLASASGCVGVRVAVRVAVRVRVGASASR